MESDLEDKETTIDDITAQLNDLRLRAERASVAMLNINEHAALVASWLSAVASCPQGPEGDAVDADAVGSVQDSPEPDPEQ